MGWPHGHDGGRERAPRPTVHDESGSAFGGVEGHAASSSGLGGAGVHMCWCVLELKLGASIYRRIDGVAVNGESSASDYGDAVDLQEV